MASMLTARDDKVGESPLAQSLTSALKGKLQASKELSVHGLTQFMEACKCSSLPDKVKNDLLQASEQVAMNLSTGPQAGPASRMQHVPQELLNVPSYLSANDWKHLEAVDMHNGVQTLVHRLKTVGVRSLKETTKKACTATLVLLEMSKGKPLPPYDTIYKLSQVFQQSFLSSDTMAPQGVPSLCKYPANAGDLGEQVLEKIYAEGDPRAPRHLANLPYMMAHHVPVRSTSSLLTSSASGSKQTNLARSNSGTGGNALGPLGDMFLQKLGEQLSGNLAALLGASKGEAATTEPKVHLLNRKKSCPLLDITNSLATAPALPVENGEKLPQPKLALTAPEDETAAATQGTKKTQPTLGTELGGKEITPAAELQGESLEGLESKMFEALKGQETKQKPGQQGHKKNAAKPVKKGPKADKKGHKAVKKEPKSSKAKAFGCPRCRGNLKGCATCWEPKYKGIRLEGRQAWKAYMAKRGKPVK